MSLLLGIEDSRVINYDGKLATQYAITITSRTQYTDELSFRRDLYQFLSSIKYQYAIQGIFETHEQKGREHKLHVHGVCNRGHPPKGNKKNSFYFKIKKIHNLDGWHRYCRKAISSGSEAS